MKIKDLLKKAETRYHIKVIPSNHGRLASFDIQHNTLRGLIIFVLGVLAVVLIWTLALALKPDVNTAYQKALSENLSLKSDLERVKTKLVMLEGSLDRLERFDRKLRVITNFGDNKRKLAIGPLSEEEMQAADTGLPLTPNEALAAKLKEKLGELDSIDLNREIERVLQKTTDQERELAELNNFLEDQKLMLLHIPSIWPTRGWVTSGFGYRVSPFTSATSFHEGLDISANVGTPVYSPGDGTVVFVGDREGYGKIVVVNHGFGIMTRYAHLADYRVQLGDRLQRGDPIGSVGRTGRTTGSHLHYEVRINNIPQNPRLYILE